MPHRTTLLLDDDVLSAARSLATTESRSLGAIISELARKGLRPTESSHDRVGGFPVFKVARTAKSLTPQMVAQAMDDSADVTMARDGSR